VSPQWLEAILTFFGTYPQYAAAMGRVRVPPAAERDPRLQALLAAYRVVPVFDKGENVRDVSDMYGSTSPSAGTCSTALVISTNGSVPRSTPGGSRTGRRILRAGMRIGYMPQALVYHEVDPQA